MSDIEPGPYVVTFAHPDDPLFATGLREMSWPEAAKTIGMAALIPKHGRIVHLPTGQVVTAEVVEESAA